MIWSYIPEVMKADGSLIRIYDIKFDHDTWAIAHYARNDI